jgi:hypothetical protein
MALVLGKYGIYFFKTWQNKRFFYFKESEATVLHFSLECQIKIEITVLVQIMG